MSSRAGATPEGGSRAWRGFYGMRSIQLIDCVGDLRLDSLGQAARASKRLAAYMVLEETPEAHGLVQRILGHNLLHATMTFYSGLETDAAIKHHDALIARHRQAAPVAAPSRARAVR